MHGLENIKLGQYSNTDGSISNILICMVVDTEYLNYIVNKYV